MGCVGGVLFPLIVFFIGRINWIQTVIIGGFVYIASLAISRAFDNQINTVTEKVLKYLNKYKKIKNFILKYF